MHSYSGCLHFCQGFKRAQRAPAGMLPGASVQQPGTYQPWLPLPLPLPAFLMACTAGGGPTLARASARRRASSFATSSSSFTC